MDILYSIRQAARDAEQGVRPSELPVAGFSGPAAEGNPPSTQKAAKRQIRPLVSENGEDYRAVYRIVFNFMEKYTPPRLEDPYYWDDVAGEMSAIAHSNGNRRFITSMLIAAYTELSENYKAAQEAQK